MQKGAPANRPQPYCCSSFVLKTVAPSASRALKMNASTALPKADMGNQRFQPRLASAVALAGESSSVRSGTSASARNRNHFRIGTANSTAQPNGSRAERSRCKHNAMPTHRNGRESASRRANSPGCRPGVNPFGHGSGPSKYERIDQSRWKTSCSTSRSRLYFKANRAAAQTRNGVRAISPRHRERSESFWFMASRRTRVWFCGHDQPSALQ